MAPRASAPGRRVCALAARYGAPPPSLAAYHYAADLGPFRLKWERHTEFIRYQFIVPGAGDDRSPSPRSPRCRRTGWRVCPGR